MVRINLAPHPHLRHLVRGYQYMDVEASPEGFVVPAQERSMLLLPWHTDYTVGGQLSDDITISRATILGPHSVPIINYASQPNRGYTVEFTPLGAMILFGIPQEEIVNRGIEAEQLLPGSLVRELCERISGARMPVDGAGVLDSILLRLLRRAEVPRRLALVEAALATISSRGRSGPYRSVRIADMGEHLGVTPRHINREFRYALGLSPKRYLLVSRIAHAMTRLTRTGNVSLTELALDLGFYDYPHFSHEFKKLTLASPTDFLSSARYAEIKVVAAGPRTSHNRSPSN